MVNISVLFSSNQVAHKRNSGRIDRLPIQSYSALVGSSLASFLSRFPPTVGLNCVEGDKVAMAVVSTSLTRVEKLHTLQTTIFIYDNIHCRKWRRAPSLQPTLLFTF